MADGEAAVAPAKKSDLGARTLSAIVMVAIAGVTLWVGGWFWAGFVALVSMVVFWEWRGLARGFTDNVMEQAAWNVGGFIYIVTAAFVLLWLRVQLDGHLLVLLIVGAVVATDVGAYFFGRSIGGPKIAPKISPSKTWAGLFGGALAASVYCFLFEIIAYGWWKEGVFDECVPGCQYSLERWWRLTDFAETIPTALFAGAIIAVIAQIGDFFESWMKRKAGVKDSGKLLPGHGGLLDRVDGLLAVLFVIGLVGFVLQDLPQ